MLAYYHLVVATDKPCYDDIVQLAVSQMLSDITSYDNCCFCCFLVGADWFPGMQSIKLIDKTCINMLCGLFEKSKIKQKFLPNVTVIMATYIKL